MKPTMLDPGSLRFPTTRFEGYLKQMDLEALGPLQRLAIATAFPKFSARGPTEDEKGRARAAVGAHAIWFEREQERRFAGGTDLPRGRYHSVCADESGDDHGCLLHELINYTDLSKSGYVFIADMALHADEVNRTFGQSFPTGRYILLIFLSLAGPTNPFMAAARAAMPDLVPQTSRMATVELNYQVRYTSIDNVLDLRRLDAQQFLVEHCTDMIMAESTGITSFAKMLPALLDFRIGGGPYTRAIGNFLRRAGISGLVYPSARADCHALQAHGTLADWGGWNLVDYRDAPVEWPEVLASGSGWSVPAIPGLRIIMASDDDLEARGSWIVDGLSSFYRSQFFRMREQLCGRLP